MQIHATKIRTTNESALRYSGVGSNILVGTGRVVIHPYTGQQPRHEQPMELVDTGNTGDKERLQEGEETHSRHRAIVQGVRRERTRRGSHRV